MNGSNEKRTENYANECKIMNIEIHTDVIERRKQLFKIENEKMIREKDNKGN